MAGSIRHHDPAPQPRPIPSLPAGHPTAARLPAAPARRRQASAANIIATSTIKPRLATEKQVLAPALQVTRPYRNRSQPLAHRRSPSRIEPRQTAAKKETHQGSCILSEPGLLILFLVNFHNSWIRFWGALHLTITPANRLLGNRSTSPHRFIRRRG